MPTRHEINATVAPPRAPLRRLEVWVDRHPRAVAVGLYAIALGLRALHWWTFRDTLAARVFLMDEAYYHEEALNLVRGLPNPTDSYFMTPIYPLFLSLVFRVTGDTVSVVYALQLALGALAAPCVFVMGRRAMPPLWALAAAVAMATCAPVIFYEALLLVEWMVLLALVAGTMFAVRAPWSRVHALAAGACLGLAVLGRGSNLVLLPVFAAWFAWRGERGRMSWAQAGRCAVGCVVVLAPLFVYNVRHAQQPLLLTANAGFNLYIGNGLEATGLFFVPEKLDLAQDPLALRFVQRETSTKVTASVAARFWLDKTLAAVRERPLRALDLLAWKWVLFWNRFSFPQVESFEHTCASLPLGRLPFWHGTWVLPLGLLGAVLALAGQWRAVRFGAAGVDRSRRRVLAFIAACAIFYASSIALFFVTDRYRVPALPWLMVLASATGSSLLTAGGRRRRVQVLGLVVGAAALFVLTDPDRLHLDRDRVERDIHVHSALRFAKADLFPAAVGEYRQALQTAPRDPDLRDGLARMLARAGDDSLSLTTYRDLLMENPRFARGWYNLGNVLRRTRRLREAVVAYQQAVAVEPWRESAWNNLGECYRALGDTAAAAQSYRRALELVPGHEQALNNLGALRGFQGDAPGAEAGFRAAIAANPRYLPAWTNLALLLTNQGRQVEAAHAWQFIRKLDPADSLAGRVLQELDPGVSTPGGGK